MSQSGANPIKYDRFPYSAIVDRPQIKWPNGPSRGLGDSQHRQFPVRSYVYLDHSDHNPVRAGRAQ